MTTDCVFCKIRDGQIPSAKVYEDAKTLAFMMFILIPQTLCFDSGALHRSIS